ncbi:MAG: quinone-dependent dihydroorotate dehydrogenase [Balneolaceae bacterium]
MNAYKYLIRPILFKLEADRAHNLTVKAVSKLVKFPGAKGVTGALYRSNHPSLHQKIWGLNFDNPIGLAAGFDKNGTLLPFMEKLGFGYIEVGSITANANAGNPLPRSFRLPEDRSLINRLGLNNDGAKTIIKRLKKSHLSIPLGVNIAKTHDPDIMGKKALNDYKFSYDLALDVADYITLNVSCPNTTEGKTFEDADTLHSLLNHLEIGNDASSPPVLIKLSVDLSPNHLNELLDVCESFAVSGYVATNTSSKRAGLSTSANTLKTIGAGGLSGAAIRQESTKKIRQIYEHTKGEKTIIGVGGIFTAEDALEKIMAGADLLQIYTGMIYEGPRIVKTINEGIAEYLREKGLDHIYQLRKKSNAKVSQV